MNNLLSTKDKAFILFSFFYIAYSIFPLFADTTGIPIFIPALTVTAVFLLMYPKAFWGQSTKWFVVYVGVLFLYIVLGKPIFINALSPTLSSTYRIIIESAWILPNITIMNVLLYRNNTRLYELVGYGSLALLVVSFLYVLPLVMSTSNILREDLHNLEVARPQGLPGYDLMHAYTLMILPLCLWVKESGGKIRYCYLAILLLFAYMVVQTAVSTSLVVMAMAVLFACIFNIKKLQRSILVFSLLLIIGYVLSQYGFFLKVVDGLMPYFEGTAVSIKLEDLHTSMVQEEVTGSSLTGRMNHHLTSIDSFLNNPIVGSDLAGRHSKILDLLGAMGLLAFIPYFMILYTGLKRYAFRIKDKELKSYLYFSFILAGVYLCTKGIFGSPGYLFMMVIVPCLLMCVSSFKRKN